ncbi:MAG: PAS domain S-box protein [Bacteroidetes bacterium]|nr:MAG: PAS domain S-box protein [Bacteroidota bacterium]
MRKNIANILSLILIVALLVVVQFLNNSLFEERKGDAQWINLAGKQRMLSQKISKEVWMYEYLSPAEKQELDSSIELFSSIHKQIWQQSKTGKDPLFTGGQVPELAAVTHQEFLEFTKQLEGEKSGIDKRELNRQGLEFLNSMDTLVGELKDNSVRKLERFTQYERYIAILIIMALATFVILVYRPRYKETLRQNALLDTLNSELQESQAQLEESLEDRNRINSQISNYNERLTTILNAVPGGLVLLDNKAKLKEILNGHLSGVSVPFDELDYGFLVEHMERLSVGALQNLGQIKFDHPVFEGRIFNASISHVSADEFLFGIEDITLLVELQDDQQILSLIASHTQEFIGLTDASFRLTYINDAGIRICGFPDIDTLRKMRITDVLDPETRRMYARDIIPQLKEKNHWKGIAHLKHYETGELIPVEASFFPVRNAAGDIVAYGTIQVDISEQIQRQRQQQALTEELQASQEELRVQVEELERLNRIVAQNEAMLNEAQSIAKMGSFYVEILPDHDMRIRWSDTMYHIYGYTKGELISFDDVVKIIPEEEQSIVYKATELAMTGERQNFEHRIVTPAGELKFLRSMIQPIMRNAQVIAMQGIAQDVTELKAIENELRFSELRYDYALNGSEDGIWDWNLENNTLYFSPRWKQMLGFRDEECESNYETWQGLIHPEDLPLLTQGIEAHLAGETDSLRVEIRLRTKDSSYKWVLARAKCIRDENQKPVRLVGTHVDISTQKKVLEELDEKRANLRAVIENTADLIWSVTHNKKLITFNKRYAQEYFSAFGRTLDQGSAAFDDFPETERIKWHKWTDRAMVGEKFSFEYIFHWPSGIGYYDIFVNPILSDSNEITGVSFFARNVTKRKELEISLTKQEEALKALYDTAFDALSLEDKLEKAVQLGCEFFDLEYGVLAQIQNDKLKVYKSFPENKEYPEGKSMPLKETYSSILKQVNGIISIEDIQNSSFKNHPAYQRFSFACFLGIPIYIHGELKASLNFFQKNPAIKPFGEGEISLLRSIAQWIENALEADLSEKQLIAAKNAAESAARAKADFLAMMSHEIRTPMNGVLGMTNLLQTTALNEEQADFVNTIKLSGESLLAIINDILDFSKIESGKLLLEEHPLSIEQTISETFDLLGQKAIEKDLELLYYIDESVPSHILSDVTRLRQVLINLISNALKFTSKGQVVVNVRVQDKKKDQYQLYFEVKDSGIGIPKEAQEKLFTAFTQVDSSTTRRFGGTGLGLAICVKLVEALGGSIGLESEPGEGSVFFFTIKTKIAPVKERLGPNPLASKKIWILDDNQTNLQILQKQCQKWGAEVRSYTDYQLILDDLQGESSPHVIIVDYILSGISGLEVAKKLKKLQREFQIVLVSTSQDQELSDAQATVDSVLFKPIKYSQLLQVLFKAQENRKQIREHSTELVEQTEQKSLRILLAEDNVFNQKLALLVLGKLGYSADLAANGIEVLEALKLKTYDLIFMDIQMPDMGGEEATALINQQMGQDRPYIIAMTANAMEGDREKYLDLGMDDYISKPIDLDKLRETLTDLETKLA